MNKFSVQVSVGQYLKSGWILSLLIFGFVSTSFAAALTTAKATSAPFLWQNASVYFLLTDRFANADKRNDTAYGRLPDAAPLRGFAGGDLAGVTQKIKQGYFNRLGVNVLWITPPVEQIHGSTDEGSGKSYGFHGYWAKDFSRIDASLGTEQAMHDLVDTAHAHGIRVLLDVVMNHTGPVTEIDPVWPESWVRTGPACTYQDMASTVTCTLVKNLPDVRTESNENVELPAFLVEKWKAEGRYEQQMRELDAFFTSTGWPRAPRYYLMKWHADWVKKYGFDGFRADTVKHVETGVWLELKQVASRAFEEWKLNNPTKKLGDQPFFMVAEVYNYAIANGSQFRMDASTLINYYDYGFDSMINFSFKNDAKQPYETLFSRYSNFLNAGIRDGGMPAHQGNLGVLNYLSSHDDDQPFDAAREHNFEAATKLLLSPGTAQIYYGDETARRLDVANASGDAKLRSFMNWEERSHPGKKLSELQQHWSRLGKFRQAHVSVGAGVHQKLSDQPYIFKRSYQDQNLNDQVLVALDLPLEKEHTIDVYGVFPEGQKVIDYYSGHKAIVSHGKLRFPGKYSLLLIGL